MDLRQLRYFVGVAEARNFSRAAERLHISQPPLSVQVRRLEEEIGTRLFQRSPRGVTLTPAGTLFLNEAKAVLQRLDQARKRARQLGEGTAGTLSVGFISIVAYGVLPPTLKAFRSRYPDVEIELNEGTTDQLVQAVRARRFDLGIALGPVQDPDLRFEPLMHEELLLALPSRHPLGGSGRAVDLRRFAEERFIAPPRDASPGLHDLIVMRCRDSGFAPRMGQQARQMQTIVSLVSSGMGIALVPASVSTLRRTGVRYCRLRGRSPGLEIGLLFPRSDEPSAVTQRFAKILKQSAT